MNCIKWGNDNSNIKNLPVTDAEQEADPNNIKWQDGFDSRFKDNASKFPTKENIDDMLAFISAKHFFKKCGGLNLNLDFPKEEWLKGNLPTVMRPVDGLGNRINIWSFLDYCCSGGFFYSDDDGNIGLKEIGLSRKFLNPDNQYNMEVAAIGTTSSFDFSILGSPENGVCGALGTGDVIYFPELTTKPVDSIIGSGINLSKLKDRSIAQIADGETEPSGFSDYPYYFSVDSSYYKPESMSSLEQYLPHYGQLGDPKNTLVYRYGIPFVCLYDRFITSSTEDRYSRYYSIEDTDETGYSYGFSCFKAINDFAMIFDFQPYLNIVKYTSYGDTDMVKEVATFDNGCVNLKNGYYHNLYMSFGRGTSLWGASWNPPIPMENSKPILIASGGQLVCDRIFVRRGSTFNFFLDTNAPVDFRFKATAIPMNISQTS